jgi:hypothetical protein
MQPQTEQRRAQTPINTSAIIAPTVLSSDGTHSVEGKSSKISQHTRLRRQIFVVKIGPKIGWVVVLKVTATFIHPRKDFLGTKHFLALSISASSSAPPSLRKNSNSHHVILNKGHLAFDRRTSLSRVFSLPSSTPSATSNDCKAKSIAATPRNKGVC